MAMQYLIAGALGLALAAFLGGVWTGQHYTALSYEAVLATLQGEAAQAMSDAMAETYSVQKRLDDTKYQLEIQDAQHQTEIQRVLDDNRRLAATVGMRDPGARAGCQGAVPESAGTAAGDHESASAELSREATAFLLGFAADADRVRAQLGACQQWASALGGP